MISDKIASAEAESPASEKCSSRSDQRRKAIVEAATAVFLEAGFAGATLDMIIERSGGSRRTLYEHFGNKEGLFSAVLCRCCERVLGSIDMRDIYVKSPQDALTLIATSFLRAITDPVNLAIYRAVCGEVTRFPEIGDVFYSNGAGRGSARLADYLRAKAADGVLRIEDPDAAADLFLGMVKGNLHLRTVFYPDYVPTDAEIDRHVATAVTMFLTATAP